MRKTTRYLIRRAAENPDIVIEKATTLENIKIYPELNKDVSKRQHFVAFSDEFIKNEFESFEQALQDQRGNVFIFGKYKGEIAAGCNDYFLVWNVLFIIRPLHWENLLNFQFPICCNGRP